MQILYVHGKDGNVGECEHYKPLFPGDEVIGVDYKTFSPWETGKEIRAAVDDVAKKHHAGLTVMELWGTLVSYGKPNAFLG